MSDLEQRKRDMLIHVYNAAQALIQDVHRRYPNEEFKCPYIHLLDECCVEFAKLVTT